MLRKDHKNANFYSNNEIFEGNVVHKNKSVGYWTTKNSTKYPNPFFIKFTKTLWKRFEGLVFICESF